MRVSRSAKKDIVLVLSNIRSAYNAGAIFRTADAVGVSLIYLTGTTPAPEDRFGRKRKDIQKTALGAESSVSWKYEKRVGLVLKKLKKQGFICAALEQDEKAISYRKFFAKNKKPIALFLGNEVEGLSESVKKKCDVILEIPMRGIFSRQKNHPKHTRIRKESLNVSVAAGIALFEIVGKS
ncbi:MAG: TrmH family RNA methyltransferase [bacterium]|nr:TrmH family RNA methyltransferase [bacterium]